MQRPQLHYRQQPRQPKQPMQAKQPMSALDLRWLMRSLIHQPPVRPRAAGVLASLVGLVARSTLAILLALLTLAGLFVSAVLLPASFASPSASARQPARAAPAAPAVPMAARLTQKVTLGETSIDGPAVNGGVFGGTVLGWTGTDAAHRLNLMTRTDSLTFAHKLTLGETSPFRPAVAQANVDSRGPFVVVAWTGSDAAHTLNVLWNAYGAPGSPRRKLTLRGETSLGAPGLVATPRIQQSSLLEVAWTGTDANHSLNVLPLQAETLARGTKTVLRQFSSDAGPNLELGVLAGSDVTESVLAWTSRAQRLDLATNELGTFEGRPDATIAGELSAAAPSTIVTDHPLPGAPPSWLGWTGTDPAHHLNLRTTTTFPRWGGGTKTVLTDTALGGPQIASADNPTRLLLAWTGTDARHRLNVAQVEFT